MLVQFKRGFLLALLALTGLAAIVIGFAVYRAGQSEESLDWAVKGALAYGMLVLMALAAFAALDRRGTLAFAGLFLAGLMLVVLPAFVAWEIVEPLGMRGAGPVVHLRMERLVEAGLLTAGLFCVIPFVLIPRMKRVARIVQYTAVLYFVAAYCGTLMCLWEVDAQHVERAVVTLLIPAVACMFGVFGPAGVFLRSGGWIPCRRFRRRCMWCVRGAGRGRWWGWANRGARIAGCGFRLRWRSRGVRIARLICRD